MIETIFKIILGIHILGGSIGLIAGTINMIRRKGDRYHKLAGDFFFFGMLTAGTAALVLSAMHTNHFLFIVGVFTIYMVGTGRRYLSLRKLGAGQKPKPVDWALAVFMMLFGTLFIGFGIYSLVKANTFGIVFMVFGYISLSMVRQDVKNYLGKTTTTNTWLTLHLQRMIGAYIASTTAFLVVNLPRGALPGYLSFIPWLLPTVIITPLIFKWTKKYRGKSTREVIENS